MSYKVDRSLGFQKWGVTNPWVFADLSQPQRQRGRVSPIIYQTQPPYLRSPHLGQLLPAAREDRMEMYAIAGLSFSALSLAMFAWYAARKPTLKANRKKSARKKSRCRHVYRVVRDRDGDYKVCGKCRHARAI